MTLEFDKLTPNIEAMAQTAVQRQNSRLQVAAALQATLDRYAHNWVEIERALETAAAQADPKHYRTARPFSQNFPLNQPIDPPPPPPEATLIATDGSQIMPDRHAAHLYYLLNVGGIVYHHGQGKPPEPFAEPELHYPADDAAAADFLYSSGKVSVERDKKEIGALANKAWAYRHAARPLLAMLDQRLLYWPIGSSDSALNEDVLAWLRGMTKVHDSSALLAGYIDRPMTGYVITLLQALSGLDDPKFDWKALGKRSAGGGLADAVLYGRLLQPFQRSPVFVMISPPNQRFAEHDPANEVCFFYLHSGQGIARVDIPHWVAEDQASVTAVHALLVDQCRILGDYPYILARADEMAVVGQRDQEELNFMIDLAMQKQGISASLTAKQGSKGLARGGKTRFEGP